MDTRLGVLVKQPSPHFHIPPSDLPFIGRAAELSALMNHLRVGRAVLMSGVGGIGKTALARAAAESLMGEFPGGIFWLHSADHAPQPSAALHDFARLLGVNPPTPDAIRGALADITEKALLVVDDAASIETLRLLRSLLPPPFTMLITARQPMPAFDAAPMNMEGLSIADGLALLQVLIEDWPGELSGEMRQPFAAMVEALNGSPLALRLASLWLGRAGGWRAALTFLKRWREIPNPLEKLSLEAPRQPALEQTLMLLYRPLSPEGRAVFHASGVLRDGAFSLETLLKTAGLTTAPSDIGAVLALLQVDSAPYAQTRYRTHRVLSGIARAMLTRGGDEAAAYRRLRAHLQDLSATRDKSPDYALMRALLRWTSQHESAALPGFLLTVGAWIEAQGGEDDLRAGLESALALPIPDDARPDWVAQIRGLGDLAARVGQLNAALAFYERALSLYYQHKSLSGQANTLKALGDLSARMEDVGRAQEYYDRTLLLYAQIDFQLGRANTLKALGDLSLQVSDSIAARDYYTRSLDLYEQADYQLGVAQTYRALAKLSEAGGDWSGARLHYQAALPIYHDAGFFSDEAAIMLAMGDLHRGLFEGVQAAAAYEDARHLYGRIGEGDGEARALRSLGALREDADQPAAALTYYGQALAIYARLEDAANQARLSEHMAGLHQGMGDMTAALRLRLDALRHYQTLHLPRHIEEAQAALRDMARTAPEAFRGAWEAVCGDAPMPDWLRGRGQPSIPQALIYAVRDFMIADTWADSQRILEKNQALLLTDSADEVFASMLRQYAGQEVPTRQIDKYRALLQRCRQIGIPAAFEEIQNPATQREADRAHRLRQSLDAYDEALSRLHDMPLVYASIQLSRAGTWRELAALPEQDCIACLRESLSAYQAALTQQRDLAPLDYASTQAARAEVLLDLADLDADHRAAHLHESLNAYAEALRCQRHVPQDYARTQLRRADALHLVAGLPGEDVHARMTEALIAYNDALAFQKNYPLDYAQTQSHRARLLYEMAGLPHEDFNARMKEALNAYDDALEYVRDNALEYAKTQIDRVALLRDMAGLPGEDRAARLYQALAACNEALRYLRESPDHFARAQVNRAYLLRELAGLAGEHRLARMRESLATFNEAVELLRGHPLQFAMTQLSRASLLREMANLSGENRATRLRQALEATTQALSVLEQGERRIPPAQFATQLANAQRTVAHIRREIAGEGEDIFPRWWSEIMGTPIPEWAMGV